jgi:8-oxo-dGTP pyrophosphatase MutT (NUDIX family)
MTPERPTPRPAATVIVLRDTPTGLETLLLRRNEALAFAGGFWVFPGGAIDPDDRVLAHGDPEQAARYAAAREAHEEAGITLNQDLGELVPCGLWIGPAGESRRYSTHYFLSHCTVDEPIVVDGSEILEHRWLSVVDALQQNLAGKLPLYPPTWFTLHQLGRFQRVQHSLEAFRQVVPLHVLPVFSASNGQHIALFEGDAGYHSGFAEHDGPRHRMWQQGNDWHYEYIDVAADIRPLDGRDLDSSAAHHPHAE